MLMWPHSWAQDWTFLYFGTNFFALPLQFPRESTPTPPLFLSLPSLCDLFQIPDGFLSACVNLCDTLSLVPSSSVFPLLQRNHLSSLVTTSLLGWLAGWVATGTQSSLSPASPPNASFFSIPSDGRDGIFVLRNEKWKTYPSIWTIVT